jgi:SAM-dependent methyltransferase
MIEAPSAAVKCSASCERYNLTRVFIRRVGADGWDVEVRKYELDCMLGCYGDFGRALELGCGSGLPSLHLSNYATEVEATELDSRKIKAHATSRVRFSQMDAQDMSRFPDGSFDLVYSSSVLEHIPDVGKCLAECKRVLRSDGLVIHTVPTNTWKLFALGLRFPALAQKAASRFLSASRPRTPERNTLEVDPAGARRPHALLPRPHGVASTHLGELLRWQERSWMRLFAEARLDVVRRVRLPFYHGYQRRFVLLLELGNRAGLSACTGYVLRPKPSNACS